MKRLFLARYHVPLMGGYLLLAAVWLWATHLWLDTRLEAASWLRPLIDVSFVTVTLGWGFVVFGYINREMKVYLRLSRLVGELHRLSLSGISSPAFEQAICRLAVEEVGLKLAWIGLLDPATQSVLPVARWGDASDYVDLVQIRMDDWDRSRGPTGTTLRMGIPVVSLDIANDPRMKPWREAALARGLRSSAALPLHIDGKVIGTLNLYAGRPHFFTDAVVELGMILAANVAQLIESRRRAIERDAAQAALAQSEARFRRLAEQASDIIFRYRLQPNPQLDFVNPAVTSILGYELDELFNQFPGVPSFLDPSQIGQVERLIEQGRGQLLLHTRRRDGNYVWLDLRFVVANGAIEGIARDVTDQVLAAARLARYELLSAHTRDIVLFIRASDGRILEANTASERAYGYSRAELGTRTIFDLRAPETHPYILDQMRQADTGGVLFETLHVRRDGSVFPVEVSSTGADIDGERVLLSVIRDISERKQAQAELDLLRRALIASDQAIVITDSHGVIEWVNPAFTALTGYHAEEVIGQHTRILRSGKQDRAFYAAMWAEILNGRTWRGTLINRRKDGSLYHEELAITPVKQENGVIAHFIAVKQDISVRVQREQQQRALMQLSAAMRVAQGCAELIQTVVHELQVLVAAQSVAFWRFKDEGWQIEQLAGEAIRFDWVAERLATVGSDTIRSEPTPPTVLPGGELVIVPLTCSVCPEYRLWVAITLLASEPFSAATIELLRATTEMIGNALHRTELFEKVQQANAELRQAYDATIEGWARALDLRDHETEGHSRRVTELTMQIAARMGFGAEELVYIRWGALLHDIGKMGIPDTILRKPGPLDEQEWAIMRTHPTLAVELLRPISFLAPALDIPWCHHEKWDGTGYPRGLRGEEIPLAARIFAVVDVYDALTSDRPYRAAWSHERALSYICEQAGRHFDPQVVAVFVSLFAKQASLASQSASKDSYHA